MVIKGPMLHRFFSNTMKVIDHSVKTPNTKRIRIPKPNQMPPRPKVCEADIREKFIKGGSGHGGQKINKTNSKVQLKHIPTGIVVTCQLTRSRDQNRKLAREILAAKLDEMEKGKRSRKQLLIARKQLVKKRAKRKSKAKYKKLEEKQKDMKMKTQPKPVMTGGEEIIIEDDDDDEVIIAKE